QNINQAQNIKTQKPIPRNQIAQHKP
uniref:Uncharacterized protein n=1 Tax=Amphimedon queenslandica TaxID=400682 RepID=A0A1X7V3D9_AMPQE